MKMPRWEDPKVFWGLIALAVLAALILLFMRAPNTNPQARGNGVPHTLAGVTRIPTPVPTTETPQPLEVRVPEPKPEPAPAPQPERVGFMLLLSGGRPVLYESAKGEPTWATNGVVYKNTEGVTRQWKGDALYSPEPLDVTNTQTPVVSTQTGAIFKKK